MKNRQICRHSNKVIFQTPKGLHQSFTKIFFGRFFAKKLSPKTSKNCQNGDKSPHLVTLSSIHVDFLRQPLIAKRHHCEVIVVYFDQRSECAALQTLVEIVIFSAITTHAPDLCTAQLARQPKSKSRRTQPIGIGTTLFCC